METSTAPESVLHQWFRRVWNEGDAAAIDELALPTCVSHGLAGDIEGMAVWKKEFYAPMRATFSKCMVEVLEEHSVGDRIFARLRALLTPAGTDAPVMMSGTCMARLVGGQIAEAWDCWDFLGLVEGMKLLPANTFQRALLGKLAAHPAVEE